ncbi:MAG: type I-U CRISPR-associated protein Cas7 [Actinobacteria bacterium]|nr:type I-U CRISPR-associated protein Cas7 [Actinomycetota bacterium]
MAKATFDYEKLKRAVAGEYHAIRAFVDLKPAGGEMDKIFPPTYQGPDKNPIYATETRIVNGEEVHCVLIDSVQSQANRMEMALLEWHRKSKEPPFPLVQIDFRGTDVDWVGEFTVLEAPHRIADAYFLACELDGKPFRSPRKPEKGSDIGRNVEEARPDNATGLFGISPTSLIFGMWDSHSKGVLGAKFQRIMASEVIGIGVTKDGKRAESRIDPLIKVAGESLKAKINEDGTWSLVDSPEKKKADSSEKKEPKKLSGIGLGNITPTLNPTGGVVVKYARQIAVISLTALRRLRFPLESKEGEREEVNTLARTVLASLSLCALTLLWEEGFSLRSRCELVPVEEPLLELVSPQRREEFSLDFDAAEDIFRKAVDEAKKVGLPWPTVGDIGPWKNGILTLKPNKDLVNAIKESQAKALEISAES